jgi:hypothetical protein
MNNGDDAPPMPLSRRPCGIETFCVEGTVDTEPVHALWDGRWATISTLLCDRVALALAVEEAFAEGGMTPRLDHESVRRSPEEFLLAVITCCDDIDIAEFEIRGRRRVIVPDSGGTP